MLSLIEPSNSYEEVFLNLITFVYKNLIFVLVCLSAAAFMVWFTFYVLHLWPEWIDLLEEFCESIKHNLVRKAAFLLGDYAVPPTAFLFSFGFAATVGVLLGFPIQ